MDERELIILLQPLHITTAAAKSLYAASTTQCVLQFIPFFGVCFYSNSFLNACFFFGKIYLDRRFC